MNPILARTVARHALGWLVAANAVGVLLAALLLWPEANTVLAPFTYGRWVPLHLDWQLYGWCSLPLIGVLLAAAGRGTGEPAAADSGLIAGVRLWSLALFLGGISWLGGEISGKLFLDWSGWARPLLPVAMTVLWLTLVRTLAGSWAEQSAARRNGLAMFLTVLGAVPVMMYQASRPGTFPPINPDSGGATGASLLVSNLGIVAIGGLLPWLLRLPRKAPRAGLAWQPRWFGPAFAASCAVFLSRPRGDQSHHDPGEIIALGLVLLWIPLLIAQLSAFAWPAAALRWLRAAAWWWAALVVTGWLHFLPGLSEAAKFTHLLVAHAHLALAGLVSSMGCALLAALGRPPGGNGSGFWWWQLSAGAHIAILTVIGAAEIADPAWLWSGGTSVSLWYAARLAAGGVQLGVSLHWLTKEFP